jgi:hypothetical protein
MLNRKARDPLEYIVRKLCLFNLSANVELGAFYYGFVGGAPLPGPKKYVQ